MRSLFSLAQFQGRQSLVQTASLRTSLTQRCSLLPIVQTATAATFKVPANYKPNPAEALVPPRGKKQIPEKNRILKRPFDPLPTKTEAEIIATLPYIVRRTPFSQLPIYRKFMSGGNRCIILVKKIDGDRAKLLSDLTTALSLDSKDIRLNPVTQHIEMKVRDVIMNHFSPP